MTLPNLFQQLGWFSLLIPVIGLILSFKIRSRPWAVFVWMPTTLFLVYASLWTLAKFAAHRGIRGPDAMGMGTVYLVLLFAMGASIAGLVASYFARPSKEAWRLSTALPAALLCAGLVILVYTPQGSVLAGRMTVVRLKLTDINEKPLAGATVRLVSYEYGVAAGGGTYVSDADGFVSLRLRHDQSAEVEIQSQLPSSGILSDMPGSWHMNFTWSKDSPDEITIYHSWARWIGEKSLNEGLTEIVQASSHVDLPINLPPRSGLVAPRLRDKVRLDLLAIRSSKPTEIGFEYACRNVEAIEFIPWLIETYRNDPAVHSSVVEGLSQTASILAQLDAACRKLQSRAANPLLQNPNYVDREFAYEVAQFSAWAGVGDSNRITGLTKARDKITDQARLLMDFSLAELRSNDAVLKILEELRQLAKPMIPSLVKELLLNPPDNLRSAQRYGLPMKLMGAKITDLQPLIDSVNPNLAILVCEALPNEDLEGKVAETVLAGLENARPIITDDGTRNRADMFIRILRARLKLPEGTSRK